MTFIQPLDLQLLFVNTFAGSIEVFMIIAFLAVMALAAFFRMPNILALTLVGLFGVMMAAYSPDFYFLIVLFAGLAIFYGIGRYIKG